MNIKQAKDEIINTVHAYLKKDELGQYQIPTIRQRPILLIGAPGIGKTQIMEQIARECRIALVSYTITHHTRQSAVGLPMICEAEYEGIKYSVTEYTMSEIISSIYKQMQETGLKEGILFIDEINCVSETLAPTILQLLQCKTFGNQSIPEGWIIVAAGNPPEYNKSVRDFDMVTLDRVRYMNVEADYHVWKAYARQQHINDAILSYLELKPNHFYRAETDVDGMSFVTARGWEDLGNLMDTYESLGIEITRQIVGEFIHHEDIAEDAAAYFELYRKYEDDYAIDSILDGKVATKIYKRLFDAEFDERISVVNLVLKGLTNRLDIYSRNKFVSDGWYAFLKDYRQKVESTDDCSKLYYELLDEYKNRFAEEQKAKIYTVKESAIRKQLLENIDKAGKNIRTDMQPKDAFDIAKEDFSKAAAVMEESENLITSSINNAFTFMEDAFANGQELVVFVTELTISPEAALFLAEHDIEKYNIYKEQLLIGTRKAQILEELKS